METKLHNQLTEDIKKKETNILKRFLTARSVKSSDLIYDSYLTTVRDLSYFSWLTPMTNIGASALGAEMITLLAPPFK